MALASSEVFGPQAYLNNFYAILFKFAYNKFVYNILNKFDLRPSNISTLWLWPLLGSKVLTVFEIYYKHFFIRTSSKLQVWF